MSEPTVLVGCPARVLRKYHQPHDWEPQPGMGSVRCPGYWVEVPPEALSGPRNARDVPEAAHSGSSALAAHHRTLAAVARVHADAIRSLHRHATSQLDTHTARLLHVLDDELARVLTRLAETADALQAQPGGGYDGPSVQECAQADRAHWTQKYAGE